MKSWSIWGKINKTKVLPLILPLLLPLVNGCAPKPKLSDLAQMKYLQATGRHEEAIAELKAYLKENSQTPYAPEVAYLIGESYMQLNQTDKAVFAYNDLTHDYPKGPYAGLGWRRMGDIEHQKGKPKEAIEKYKHSMKINGADFNVERCTVYIARIYENDLKDQDAALAEYGKLLKELKNPRIASEAYLAAAKIHLSKNNRDEAIKLLETILKDYPDNAEAQEAGKLLAGLKG
ncbi:MAG: tetratricopeptide repeat protein [Candidatus Schekmanbacteria bacterium]|nr:tetratricopeptide repeat protein [Candidatus Schekmanbacteria bacterium]